jgi:multiple RNA-binding domain-containing protein 1
MAETTILTETKSYLAEHGINLSSLTTPPTSQSKKQQRSETVIIAKNFPYGTTSDELLHLFGGTEIVKRILLPPAGTIAFLDFFDAGQARAAFKRLAYRRFKDVPLYLEKAPQGIFTVEPTQKLVGIQAKPGSSDLLTTETDDEPGSTLYVKNLDFSTTQAALADAFKHFPGFRVALLKTKPPNARGERLSMGFGFVTFASKETASAALNAGIVLDGRALEVKFARQGAGVEIKAGKGGKVNVAQKKLIVKNLGFNVNKRDLRELFGYLLFPPSPEVSPISFSFLFFFFSFFSIRANEVCRTYGHIQSLRLPKKFDNSTRGFAFIEFTTASDARNAMESLKHTHLLGRHLVLEWAEEEELGGAVEKTRGKVREGVEAGEVGRMMGFNQGSSGGRVLDDEEI